MSYLFGQVEEFVPRVKEEGMYRASPASNLKESIPVSCRKRDQVSVLNHHLK